MELNCGLLLESFQVIDLTFNAKPSEHTVTNRRFSANYQTVRNKCLGTKKPAHYYSEPV